MDIIHQTGGIPPGEKVLNDEKAMPESAMKPTGRRNIMFEKFQAYVEPALEEEYKFTPKPFFFYGSLTDPSILQQVLRLPDLPQLKPARVRSHKIMLWGQYPVLVNGRMDSYVDGMAYVVETEEHVKMLEHYETEVYHVEGIRIQIDGKKVSGRVFKWAANDYEDLTEGSWSLSEWRRAIEEEMASHFQPVEE